MSRLQSKGRLTRTWLFLWERRRSQPSWILWIALSRFSLFLFGLWLVCSFAVSSTVYRRVKLTQIKDEHQKHFRLHFHVYGENNFPDWRFKKSQLGEPPHYLPSHLQSGLLRSLRFLGTHSTACIFRYFPQSSVWRKQAIENNCNNLQFFLLSTCFLTKYFRHNSWRLKNVELLR